MIILDFCNNITILKIIRIIQIAIKIIKIIIPLILIVTIMIDFLGVIKPGDEDLLNKTLKSSVKKIIAAIIIFLLPTLVNIIFVIAGSDENYCITQKVTSDSINEAARIKADEYINRVYSTLEYDDYYNAINVINIITDINVRDEYQKKLDDIYDEVMAKHKEKTSDNQTTDSTSNSTSNPSKTTNGIIFMGDSRTHGMQLYTEKENEIYICADNTGYKELSSSHINSLKNKLNESSNTYNVAINYGVNDLGNVDNYCNIYAEIANLKNVNHLYVVSINPVREPSTKTTATNEMIKNFNNKIISCVNNISKASYCATNNSFPDTYIDSTDIHYTKEGYSVIHDRILNCIN